MTPANSLNMREDHTRMTLPIDIFSCWSREMRKEGLTVFIFVVRLTVKNAYVHCFMQLSWSPLFLMSHAETGEGNVHEVTLTCLTKFIVAHAKVLAYPRLATTE